MAKRTVLVCDKCGTEVAEKEGGVMRLAFADARRGAKEADLCNGCAEELPGRSVARRGRRPNSAE